MNNVQLTLLYLIIGAFAFLVALVKQMFFRRKNHFSATNSKRAMAFFLDLMLFNVVLSLAGVVYFILSPELRGAAEVYMNDIIDYGKFFTFVADWLWLEMLITALYCFYAAIFEATVLQGSLGTYYMDLKVQSGDGKRPGFLQSLGRAFVKFISIVGWPVFILFSLVNSRRQWLHDMLTNTEVVEIKN